MKKNVIQAHTSSSHHRAEIERSDLCGYFYCVSTFLPQEIDGWCDEGETAICPKCRIDSVIGSASGYPLSEEFLASMKQHWF